MRIVTPAPIGRAGQLSERCSGKRRSLLCAESNAGLGKQRDALADLAHGPLLVR